MASYNITGGSPSGNLNFAFTELAATGVLASVPIPYQELLRSRFAAQGALADQVDGIYYKQLTFVASTPQTLALNALNDPLGNSLTIARVRLLVIKVYWTTDNIPLLVGDAATNPWLLGGALSPSTAVFPVFPSSTNNDGFFVLQAPQTTGMAVNSSTAFNLLLNPQTAAGQVDVLMATCST